MWNVKTKHNFSLEISLKLDKAVVTGTESARTLEAQNRWYARSFYVVARHTVTYIPQVEQQDSTPDPITNLLKFPYFC